MSMTPPGPLPEAWAGAGTSSFKSSRQSGPPTLWSFTVGTFRSQVHHSAETCPETPSSHLPCRVFSRCLKRAATLANGWNPAGVPVDGMAQMMASLRSMAQAAGRDPASLELVVRANLMITTQPLGKERGIFSGAPEEIESDIKAVRTLGATELFFDATFSPGTRSENDFLRILEEIRRMI